MRRMVGEGVGRRGGGRNNERNQYVNEGIVSRTSTGEMDVRETRHSVQIATHRCCFSRQPPTDRFSRRQERNRYTSCGWMF